jgi:hypothetical protein
MFGELPEVNCHKCGTKFQLPFHYLHDITEEEFLCKTCFNSTCMCGSPGTVMVTETNGVLALLYDCGTRTIKFPSGQIDHNKTTECRERHIAMLQNKLNRIMTKKHLKGG